MMLCHSQAVHTRHSKRSFCWHNSLLSDAAAAGIFKGMNNANGMIAAPVEFTCPEGHYANRFDIKPSTVRPSRQRDPA
jgi:hypothetical protein